MQDVEGNAVSPARAAEIAEQERAAVRYLNDLAAKSDAGHVPGGAWKQVAKGETVPDAGAAERAALVAARGNTLEAAREAEARAARPLPRV